MKANVHIYALVRFDITNVEGTSDRHILEKAEGRVDLETFQGRRSFDATYEYDGAVQGFLIDELDQRGNIIDSRDFDPHMEPENPELREGPCVRVPVKLLETIMESLSGTVIQEAKAAAVGYEGTAIGKEYLRLMRYMNPAKTDSAAISNHPRKSRRR